MLSIILTGAALIREREHGTIEHLLVMPRDAGRDHGQQGLVDGAGGARGLRLRAVTSWCRGCWRCRSRAPIALFLAGAALHLFATTSMGIFLAHHGALDAAVRAADDPGPAAAADAVRWIDAAREHAAESVQVHDAGGPTTHFVMLAQAILFRGAGLDVVWPQFLPIGAIGCVLFWLALRRFREAIGQMA